jgi:hypothetical protein
MIRQAYPNAKIAAMRPFCGRQADMIEADVDECRAAGDNAVYYIDTTDWYSGDIHPGAAACIPISQKLVAALKADVLDK